MNPYAIPTTVHLSKIIERPQPTKFLTKLRITVDSIELNNSANIRSQLLTENEDYSEETKLYLTGADYTNWKEDGFIVDWVKQQLNISDSSYSIINSNVVVDASWLPLINMDGSMIISIPNMTVDVSNNITDLSYSVSDASSVSLDLSNAVFDFSGANVDTSGNDQ